MQNLKPFNKSLLYLLESDKGTIFFNVFKSNYACVCLPIQKYPYDLLANNRGCKYLL